MTHFGIYMALIKTKMDLGGLIDERYLQADQV